MSALFRYLPAMDTVLSNFEREFPQITTGIPRSRLRELCTEFLDSYREKIRQGSITQAKELALPQLMQCLAVSVQNKARPHFRRVINATGVIIHTNLGRSLLAEEAVTAIQEAARHYSNLEFDLETGQRGSRYSHVEQLICKLTGAEAALVVNNNAAAVLLVLDTLCKGREVIVSRGQLVEIGGSFRIPEIMEKSGCTLREVGATNRTHLRDYENALTAETAAILKVHTSNYRIIGFTKEVSGEDLADLAHARSLPAIEDLGSGSLCNFAVAGIPFLADEPTAQSAIASGMDVVTFSGDKVLGGPQAGIIAGKQAYIAQIKKNPLNRALRIDKLTLAALESTLYLYQDPALALKRIPTLRMMGASSKELRARAQRLVKAIRAAFPPSALPTLQIEAGASRVGGGAFPECDLPTFLVHIIPPASTSPDAQKLESPDKQTSAIGSPPLWTPEALRQKLLHTTPPVIVRLERNALCLDVRTLSDADCELVANALHEALITKTIPSASTP